jgi:CRP/FNR family cyclic AMP-dependent transcriptional regulator
MILLEESTGETFFIITSGTVKVTRLSDDGREVNLALLGESDFFGEMSLLDGEGRSANIVANEDAEVMTLSRRDFLEYLETYPKIAIALLEELAVRIRKSDQQIESLSLSDSEQLIGGRKRNHKARRCDGSKFTLSTGYSQHGGYLQGNSFPYLKITGR